MAIIKFGRLKIKIKPTSSKLEDMLGLKFGRLTVLAMAKSSKSGAARWVCRCDCDAKARKIVRGDSLRSGATQSCGCLRRESARLRGLDRPKVESKPRKPRQRRPSPQRFVYTDPAIANLAAESIGPGRNWHRYCEVMAALAEEYPGAELVPAVAKGRG
jgi:hypothetical protein